MPKNLLVTIGDNPAALYGVKFLNSFFQNKHDLRCTLLYVGPNPRAQLDELEVLRRMKEIRKREAHIRKKGEAALEKAEKLLVGQGFSPESIKAGIHLKLRGTVGDIIHEGIKGGYEAVVLGRRGQLRLAELLDDRVTKSMVVRKIPVPVWICRMQGEKRKKVLLCVDGSGPSLRASGHAGRMLENEPGHDIRLFHVWDPSRQDRAEAENHINTAADALKEQGIAEDRVSSEIVTGTDCAGLIMRAADNGRFAVVAVGSTGAGRGLIRRMIMGSVSLKLQKDLANAALWVSH